MKTKSNFEAHLLSYGDISLYKQKKYLLNLVYSGIENNKTRSNMNTENRTKCISFILK